MIKWKYFILIFSYSYYHLIEINISMKQFENEKITLSFSFTFSLTFACIHSLWLSLCHSHYFVNKQTLCLFVEVSFPHVNVCRPMVYYLILLEDMVEKKTEIYKLITQFGNWVNW